MIDTAELPAAAEAVLARPYRARRLRGGYSWRTYLVEEAGGRRVVVRVAPEGGTLEPYDPERERVALERVAGVEGVPAPEVVASGPGFLVETEAPGAVLRTGDVTDPELRARYRRAFACALGRLHRLREPGTVGEALAAELELMRAQYETAALRRYPGFEHGIAWLRARLPDDAAPARFCHGDYRFNNIAWTGPGEIGAILDWERSGAGDPLADVAFTRLYSGWCVIDGEDLAAYRDESGIEPDPERIAYLVRFERVRSYTASMRGHRAYAEGRSDDPRLRVIGEAGEHGMEELLAWR